MNKSKLTVDDEINSNDGTIDIEILDSIWLNKKRLAFDQLLLKILEKQKSFFIKNGVPKEIINKLNYNFIHLNKKPRDPQKCCNAICMSSKLPCSRNKINGSNFCAIHTKKLNSSSSNSSLSNENTINNNDSEEEYLDETYETNNKVKSSVEIIKRENDLHLWTYKNNKYLTNDKEIYKLPIDYDRTVVYDIDDLDLVGNIEDNKVRFINK